MQHSLVASFQGGSQHRIEISPRSTDFRFQKSQGEVEAPHLSKKVDLTIQNLKFDHVSKATPHSDMNVLQAKIIQSIRQKQVRKKSAAPGKRVPLQNFGLPATQPIRHSFEVSKPSLPAREVSGRRDSANNWVSSVINSTQAKIQLITFNKNLKSPENSKITVKNSLKKKKKSNAALGD
jgi:hypothetical protein